MKKKIPKKITLDSLEKSAIKYLEKYSATEYQLKKVLRRNIIKSVPRPGDPYFTVVCEFRRHYLRKD